MSTQPPLQIDVLKALQAQMRYEDEYDYDGQASPRFWVIKDYKTVPGNEEYDNGYTAYMYQDGDTVLFTEFDEIVEFLEENDYVQANHGIQHYIKRGDFDDLWGHLETNYHEFNSCYVHEVSYIAEDTCFLTKLEAQQHLTRNKHHYSPRAHTYAMTAWRSPQMKAVIDLLLRMDMNTVQVNPIPYTSQG